MRACLMQVRWRMPLKNQSSALEGSAGSCNMDASSICDKKGPWLLTESRLRNGCKLVADTITKVYSWQSNHPGIKCCNCFLRRDSVNTQAPFLSQMDEASMLQLPAEPSKAEL